MLGLGFLGGENTKNGYLCPILAVKNRKNGGFLRFFGCFYARRGVFLGLFVVGRVIFEVGVDFVFMLG